MHRFGLKIEYGGQKMGIMTVFWPTTIFRLGLINKKYLMI